MAAPWAHVVRARIKGVIHGQQTINVLYFATNTTGLDAADLNAFFLALAQALLACVIDNALPGITSDWRLEGVDAQQVHPTLGDPIDAPAPANTLGTAGATSVSFASTLVSTRTGSGGRRGRGRIFLPPGGEADIANSVNDASVTDAIVALLTCMAGKFVGTSASTDWRWCVLSRKDLVGGSYDTALREVLNWSVRTNTACLRSRKVGRGS